MRYKNKEIEKFVNLRVEISWLDMAWNSVQAIKSQLFNYKMF